MGTLQTTTQPRVGALISQSVRLHKLANANDTAGKTGASIAGSLAVRVVGLAKVILAGVHHNGAAHNGVGASQGQEAIIKLELGNTLGVGNNVAKITSVPGKGGESRGNVKCG